MAWLARNKETMEHGSNYVFGFDVLEDSKYLGWTNKFVGVGVSVTRSDKWQGPKLEPGAGPIKVKLVKDED